MPKRPYKKQKSSGRPRKFTTAAVMRKQLTLSEYPIKLTTLARHSTSGGGIIGQNVHCMDPSACTDWASCASLFDLYRVNKVVITAFPAANSVEMSSGVINNPIHVAYDPDSVAVPTTEDGMIQMAGCKTHDVLKRWTFSVKPINTGDSSVSYAGLHTVVKKGKTWLDIAQVANYQAGVVGWYGSSQPNSIQEFTLRIDYYVSFCNRR